MQNEYKALEKKKVLLKAKKKLIWFIWGVAAGMAIELIIVLIK